MAACPSCGAESPEAAKFCASCGERLTPAEAPEQFRKTVTILFSDVVGSTTLGERLDPETLSQLMTEYFEAMKPVLERHGGTVAKFIGDAVLAVFGIPNLHEDDALRAVRAALEMRESLEALNREFERRYGVVIATRTGLNTGAVAGIGLVPDRNFVAGDAANVAARLQQLAPADEIILSPATYSVVRGAVEVEELPPLELKGKSAPVVPRRLVRLVPGADAVPRRLDAPMIGRDREQRRLEDAWRQALSERACHVFTILGSAGVGKSRLVEDFLAGLNGVTVARGRCLSYGEGITFWPLAEILVQLLGKERPRSRLDELGIDPVACGHVASLLGDAATAVTSQELFWAVRQVFEAEGAIRPLLLVVDDLQWAEPTFLDLLEHIADWSRDTPILLLCIGRPELIERRPHWADGKINAASLVLEPLDRDECDRLLDMLAAPADGDLRARILTAADGIPLFIEEMAAMLVAQGDRNEHTDEILVPASIQALLAARLEQLPAPERTVLQRGSVEGQLFHHGFLRAALPQQSDVDGCVRTLVRKELLRADRPQLPGEQASSFRHILIRDSAYEALPKRARADVHEHFGSWLSERAAGLAESDEIIAYHYEQAHLYRTELGLAESGGELATRAGELLATAARRASHRSDYRAASSLLRRAVKLLPPGPARVRALLHLGRLAETDQLTRTRLVLEQAEAEAKSLGLAALEIQAALELAHPLIDPNFSTHEQEALAARAIDVLGRHGDDEGLARAWFLLAMVRWSEAQSDRMQEPLERALEHARRAGQRGAEIGALRFLLTAKNLGSTPVDEGIEFARQTLREVGDSRELEAMVLRTEGWLLCLQGRLDEARERLEHARAIITDLGHTVFLAILAFSTGALEVRAGDLDAAEREYRNALESLQRLGERGRSTNLAAVLALVLLDQERPDEAEEYVTMSRELAAREDASGQAFWRIAAARLLAQRGETDNAIELADEAVSLLAPTEELLSRFELLLHQAEVLRFAGREADAAAAIEQAIELSERKGASGETRRARERLASLSSSRG